ncbi:hypothetical protein ROG8370_03540 [Roseovarius gaetbuli]|uniref:Uncharacterized protein n=1 Tax=Roseovarius gaetbuli TaxID=1356575 RepID=A0A1X7A7T7_9RHOB|nr:hypothetical protein [Roseovarius gaetbuli]SLN72774.1 hypothetical protein ROG8370_03540 [Roseovarius gaetbuli]
MQRHIHGQIAALEYHDPPEMEFPDIVEEFDIAMQKISTQVRSLTWDGEDIALIDREAVRIALGWLPPVDADAPLYLVIAVGAKTTKGGAGFDASAYEVLLRRIINRVRSFMPFDAVLRGEANRPVGSALMDDTFELLAHSAGDSAQDRASRTAPAKDRSTPNPTHPAKAKPGPSHRNTEDAQEAELVLPEATVPMRLTIVTLGVTLFLHAPPIGAALLTYTFLREASTLAT